MADAGQHAADLKKHIEEAESILSQLETPEAKFDYSSYTEPIKKQAQDVTDYTGNFNVALTKYEAKVKELDDTLAKELIAAVPETVLKAFDPSCLLGGDTIHMQGGDIIDTLEAHNSIDIGGKLSDAQLENILAMLFDKKDIDVSGLSREDFEVAFLNLPEEKQKAILMEMGLTRRQIDSILESKESKRSFVDQLCDSKAKDRFNNILKNSSYAPKTTSKNGSGNTAPSSSGAGQSGYNNGTTQCDSNSPSCSYPRLLQTEYDEIATELIEAANALCDDDPSNDAQAMQTINENLARGFYFEDIDDTKCLMYDADFMEYCKEQAGEGSLLWGLLTDFGDYISENGNGKVSTFDGNAWFPSYSLEISQQGAGYQLILNVDSDWGFGAEVTDLRVAYAATEETAKNYLGSEGNWNWDNIDEWLTSDVIDYNSVEYTYFAYGMLGMTDDEIEHIIETGQVAVIEDYQRKCVPSSTLVALAIDYRAVASSRCNIASYQAGMKDIPDGMEVIDFDKARMQEARAMAFYQAIDFIMGKDGPCLVEFNVENKDKVGNYYKVTVTELSKLSNSGGYSNGNIIDFSDDNTGTFTTVGNYSITVYPRGCDLDVAGDDIAKETMASFLSAFVSENGEVDEMVKEAKDYALGKIYGLFDSAGLYSDIEHYLEECNKAEKVLAACDALDIGDAAESIGMTGVLVNVNGESVLLTCAEYDKNVFTVRLAVYNSVQGTNISTEEMFSSYQNGDDKFDKYVDWYFTEGKKEILCYVEAVSHVISNCGYVGLEDLSEEELNEVIGIVSQALDCIGEKTVTNTNLEAIENEIDRITGK